MVGPPRCQSSRYARYVCRLLTPHWLEQATGWLSLAGAADCVYRTAWNLVQAWLLAALHPESVSDPCMMVTSFWYTFEEITRKLRFKNCCFLISCYIREIVLVIFVKAMRSYSLCPRDSYHDVSQWWCVMCPSGGVWRNLVLGYYVS